METKLIMGLVLAVIGLLLLRGILKRDRNMTSRINIEDLLIGPDGKVSKSAAIMIGSFIITSWMMVYMTMGDKMTEGYFTAYLAAWVIPFVTYLIKGQPVAATTETTVATTRTTTTPENQQ